MSKEASNRYNKDLVWEAEKIIENYIKDCKEIRYGKPTTRKKIQQNKVFYTNIIINLLLLISLSILAFVLLKYL